jgi:hypothetical protein
MVLNSSQEDRSNLRKDGRQKKELPRTGGIKEAKPVDRFHGLYRLIGGIAVA